MTERPIIFSAPMVTALLAGRKTQTRRVIKPQPPSHITGAGRYGSTKSVGFWEDKWSWLSGDPTDIDGCQFEGEFRTGYREGGLWVREELFRSASGGVRYAADERKIFGERWRWKRDRLPAMFMPRTFSRLTLTITDVRVERLRQITMDDAKAEGLLWVSPTWGIIGIGSSWAADPREAFAALWDSLNARRSHSWESNPWVVALNFTAIRTDPRPEGGEE